MRTLPRAQQHACMPLGTSYSKLAQGPPHSSHCGVQDRQLEIIFKLADNIQCDDPASQQNRVGVGMAPGEFMSEPVEVVRVNAALIRRAARAETIRARHLDACVTQ